MNIAKLENNNLLVMWADSGEAGGYKKLVVDEMPVLKLMEGVVPRYEETSDTITVHYDIVEYDSIKVRKEIVRIKKLLTDSDYKLLKFQEGLLTTEQYEPTRIQRISWRDKINELEKHLNHE